MPGRRTPPMPDRLSPQWAISALTSVPVQLPGGRMHDQPRRLVDDDQVVVLVDDVERDVLRLRRRPAPAAARRRAMRVAGVDAMAGIADRARRRSRPAPSRISALRRERDSSATRAASTRSSRSPACSRRRPPPFRRCARMSTMSHPSADDEQPLDPAAGAHRRQGALADADLRLRPPCSAIAAVLGVIGYRVFRSEGRSAPPT